MYIFLIVVLFLIVFAIVVSIVDNQIIKVREYTIKTKKLNKAVKIVFLSDMHGQEHGKDNCKLISKISDIKPDYVLAGGDMINGKVNADFSHVVDFFESIKNEKIVYGIGNHEYRVKYYTEEYQDRYQQYVTKLRNLGIKVVENEKVFLDEIIEVQGLMVDREYYKRRGKLELSEDALTGYIGERNTDIFRILLAHNPEFAETYATQADLVLSGHMHGGIMRLPFINGVISTKFKLFPRYAGGMYRFFDSVMIVSRGLGSHTIPLRIFNPTELVVINIINE